MNIKIKKFDTCYTFVLRWFNILNKCIDIESDDFIKNFTLHTFDTNTISNDDVIVYTTENLIYAATELKNYIPVSNKISDGLHFCIFFGNLIYDITFVDGIKHIRVRNFKDVNFTHSCVRVIKSKDLWQYQKL
jgi:hypothetical protein